MRNLSIVCYKNNKLLQFKILKFLKPQVEQHLYFKTKKAYFKDFLHNHKNTFKKSFSENKVLRLLEPQV